MTKPVKIEVDCNCGASVAVETYTLVNAEEAPHLEEKIRCGEFHHVFCLECQNHIQVDKWFLFQDARRGILVHVFPREYRHSYRQLQEQLVPLHRLCGVQEEGEVELVFGIDGLIAFLNGEAVPPPVLFPDAIPNAAIRN